MRTERGRKMRGRVCWPKMQGVWAIRPHQNRSRLLVDLPTSTIYHYLALSLLFEHIKTHIFGVTIAVTSNAWSLVCLPYCYYYLRVLYFAKFCDLQKIAKLSTRKNFYPCVNICRWLQAAAGGVYAGSSYQVSIFPRISGRLRLCVPVNDLSSFFLFFLLETNGWTKKEVNWLSSVTVLVICLFLLTPPPSPLGPWLRSRSRRCQCCKDDGENSDSAKWPRRTERPKKYRSCDMVHESSDSVRLITGTDGGWSLLSSDEPRGASLASSSPLSSFSDSLSTCARTEAVTSSNFPSTAPCTVCRRALDTLWSPPHFCPSAGWSREHRQGFPVLLEQEVSVGVECSSLSRRPCHHGRQNNSIFVKFPSANARRLMA